ncbi:D-beta-hydroxybutyrate dehydrogenase, mitochondrial-like [Mya arenaria]|uniref:D-beta-hydroxybutyrate dehydrogenase, mitochondrial-like n=1 Tax=Mya arenaria TaxID=6604 RepID=UPI0022E21B46|nr:D-beta-hydroxybutyrate dehydrogenase, mitochondrial-like [Mya arenaria]
MNVLEHINVQFVECLYVVTLGLTLYSVFTQTVYLYVACITGLYICLKVVRKKTTGGVAVKNKGVFITGCDTGFGHDVARRFDDLGFIVFAGCLKPEGEGARKLKSASSKSLHVVALDVRSDESLELAHEYVKKHLPSGGLWAIVNNAGLNIMGDVELLTIDLYRKCMDINFSGAVRTLRRFLYLVRESKGRVAIVTSVKGRYSWPANSAYHVTKHGLETLADCLRLEMRKFEVGVAVVEPGNFSNATACQNEEVFKRYEEELNEIWAAASPDVKVTYGRKYVDAYLAQQRASTSGGGLTTRPVVDALEDAVVSTRPHTRYMVDGGWFDPYAILARFYDYLPTCLSDLIIRKMTGCDRWPDYKKPKLE